MTTERSRMETSPFEPIRERLEAWRARREGGRQIPGEIWKAAVKLARQFGVSKASRELRLGFRELRARTEKETKRRGASQESPERFVEVSRAIGFVGGPECLVEVESRGACIRIALSGRGISEAARVVEVVMKKGGR